MANEKRLIDARYLTSQMYLICEVCQTENIFIDAIIDEIDNAPDVDAVEVVRCKDCKHACVVPPPLVSKETLACTKTINWRAIEADHFCSYGERREGDVE